MPDYRAMANRMTDLARDAVGTNPLEQINRLAQHYTGDLLFPIKRREDAASDARVQRFLEQERLWQAMQEKRRQLRQEATADPMAGMPMQLGTGVGP